jgi:hypothetical protein
MRLIARSLLLTVFACGQAAAFDITACQQVVPPRDVGVLLNDLDCSASTPPYVPAITLGRGSALDLQGHSVIGPADGNVIDCEFGANRCHNTGLGQVCVPPRGSCTVSSTGGTAQISGAIGIRSDRSLVVSDVAIVPTLGGVRIHSTRGRLTATNVTVTGGTDDGVAGGRKVLLTNVSATDTSGIGILTYRSLRGTDVTANDNAQGGVATLGKLEITGLTALNNGGSPPTSVIGGGVWATRVSLVDSVVTGNFYDGYPTDISAYHDLDLVNTTCGTSRDFHEDFPGPTWGVCSND